MTVKHPLFARFFERVGARDEERGQAELRRELVAGLTGRVIEVGAGTGLNFRHYPDTVHDVLAVEPEPYLRARAHEAAGSAPVPIRVVGALADGLPVPDGSADAVVVSGVLCSVSAVAAVLAEFRRALRPEGQLRFYEHVRGAGIRGRWQDLVNLAWPRLMGGCETNRDARAALLAAGYRLDRCREFVFPAGARLLPVAPKVLGAARP